MKQVTCLLLILALLLSMAGCYPVGQTPTTEPTSGSAPATEPSDPQTTNSSKDPILGVWVFNYYSDYSGDDEQHYSDISLPDLHIKELHFYADGTGYIKLGNGQESYISWSVSSQEDTGLSILVNAAALPAESRTIQMRYSAYWQDVEYGQLTWDLNGEYYLSMTKVSDIVPETSLVWTDTAADIPGTWQHAYYYQHFELMYNNELICVYGTDSSYNVSDGFEIQELRFEPDGTGYIITMFGEKSSLHWWISWQDENTIDVEYDAGGHMSSREGFDEQFTIDSESKIYHTLNHCVCDCYSAALVKTEGIDQEEPQPEGSFLYKNSSQDVLFTWEFDCYTNGSETLGQYEPDPCQIARLCLLDDSTGFVEKQNGETVEITWFIERDAQGDLLIQTTYVTLRYHLGQDDPDRHRLTFEAAEGVTGVLKKDPGPTKTDEVSQAIVYGDRYILGSYIFSPVSLTLDGVAFEGLELVASDGILVDAVIPSHVNGIPVISIGDQAFFYNDALRSVEIPQGVVHIGAHAFSCCHSLLSIGLPDTLIQIGDSAFSYCCFTEIVIPGSVSSIGESAFEGCTQLVRVELAEGLLYLGDRAFTGCTMLETINLPEGLLRIGSRAFQDCDSILTMQLPKSLQEIGAYAFFWSTGLTEVRITPQLKADSAFIYASSLEKVIVEEGVTTVPDFYQCINLREISIPEGVTKVLGFGQSLDLDYIRIPGSVTCLDGWKRNTQMFYQTHVGCLEICEGVTTLGAEVFRNADFDALILPSSLEELGEDVFKYASVDQILFHGTKAQCPQELQDQAAGIDAPIYYYSEARPPMVGNYWHYVDGQPVIW